MDWEGGVRCWRGAGGVVYSYPINLIADAGRARSRIVGVRGIPSLFIPARSLKIQHLTKINVILVRMRSAKW